MLIPHLNGRTSLNIASSGSGDIQFGLPAVHLRARRGVATQKFSGALRAPMAEPPHPKFLNLPLMAVSVFQLTCLFMLVLCVLAP